MFPNRAAQPQRLDQRFSTLAAGRGQYDGCAASAETSGMTAAAAVDKRPLRVVSWSDSLRLHVV
jgi:hypothetical protein